MTSKKELLEKVEKLSGKVEFLVRAIDRETAWRRDDVERLESSLGALKRLLKFKSEEISPFGTNYNPQLMQGLANPLGLKNKTRYSVELPGEERSFTDPPPEVTNDINIVPLPKKTTAKKK